MQTKATPSWRLFRKTSPLLTASVLLALNPAHGAEQRLNPIQVSVTKVQMAPEDVAASISIVTAEEIRESGAGDVFEAIRRTTGVTVGANGSSIAGRKSIQIRGMNSEHVLMLVDGKRLTNTDSQISHSNFQLNAIPIDSIDHIEIVRGPMSSLYGSAGMAGVINVVTKQAGKSWRSAIDVYYGEIDKGDGGEETKVSFTTSGPLAEHVGLRLAVEASDTEVTPDKDGDPAEVEVEGQEIEAISVGLNFEISPQHRLSVDVDESREDRLLLNPYYDIARHLYALGYKGEVAGMSVDAKLYESYTDSYYVASSSPYYHYLTDTVFSVDVVKQLNDMNRVVVGGEVRNEKYDKDYDSPSKTDFKDEIDYFSLFAQDDISLLDDRLGVTAGLRYDDHDRFGDELSPKLYLDYQLNDLHSIAAGYGHGFKAPTVTQASDTYSVSHGPTTRYIGNSSLQPETSDSYEVSWTYDSGRTRTRTTLFYNDIENLIDSTKIGGTGTVIDPNIFQYSNVHTASTRGLEFEVSHPLSRNLDFSANYTFMRTEDGENNNKELRNRPRHFGNVQLRHHYGPWDLDTIFNWEYIGTQYMGTGETDPVPAYSLLDLTFVKAVTKSLEVRTGITNITDVRLDDESPNFDEEEERGRFYFVGLRKTFGD
ncbi:MAG: TonB-dependent receptor [Chromatiales bacterium]|jgi:outer membrane receptor for ferrienterochelin and colicins